MRIAYVVPQCVPTNSHGRYILEMVSAFGPQHDVHVISAAFPDRELTATTRQIPLPNQPTVARLAAWWTLSPILLRNGGFDIIHTVGADAPVGTIITAPCCNRGIRLALSRASESSYSKARPAWLTRSMGFIAESADRYCVRRAQVRRILAPSRQVASELETLYHVKTEKLALVPWGVDPEVFSPDAIAARRDAARSAFGIEPDEFVFITVGGAYWLKGLRGLLEALRKQDDPKVRLLLAGISRNAELAAEEQNGLTGRLVFAGPVADVLQAYAAADAFVLPTLYDGFSLATLEAMACGLPVIISSQAGISDWLTKGEDALVLECPRDADEIARALRLLVSDVDLQKELSLRARQTALQYSWKAVAARVMAEYQRAA